MEEARESRRDSVFRILFKEKEKLLRLYNAVNGSDYSDPEELEITTLENAVYLGMKNDLSFLIDFRLNIFEQQSSTNANMPLRSLFYVSRVLQRLTASENLYGSRLIPLPEPQFVVFYNGSTKRPELREYMLYCDKLRERRKTEELDIAVKHTVNECIKEGILKKFLMENKAEVRA